MSSDRLVRNDLFLRFIANPPTIKQRQAIIKIANEEQIQAISEIIINTLAGNVDLNKEEKDQLSAYKKDLRRVSLHRKTSWKSRRNIIAKMGKAVSFLTRKALIQ